MDARPIEDLRLIKLIEFNMDSKKKHKKLTYLSIEKLLLLIEKNERSKFINLFKDNKEIFQESRGSTNNHQAWIGGYLNHIEETMNVALKLYDCLNILRPLPFSKSDVLIVIFSHDLEKPWKYIKSVDGSFKHKSYFKIKGSHHQFRIQKLKEYQITLTTPQENAVKYIEGELDDYTNKKRVMGSLAAFCHTCDIVSARLWFNHPLKDDDPWEGSCRAF